MGGVINRGWGRGMNNRFQNELLVENFTESKALTIMDGRTRGRFMLKYSL